MPVISVIVTVYNGKKTIKGCLDSIFKQNFSDFEVIVVNDGPTDGTTKILKQYKNKIKIINQENRGASAARNRGEQDCSAPFVIFWDADITAKPLMLEKMYQALKKNSQTAYAYSAFKFGFKTFNLWPFDSEKLKKMPYI